MWETDVAAMREALPVHDAIVSAAISEQGGFIFKTGGDSFCASFASPTSALEAALAAQRQLLATDWGTASPIAARMGLHTGTAQIRDGDYFGPTLNRAARIMSAGHGGQILCSATTQTLLLDELPLGVKLTSLGTQYLKDLDRPETIFQVVADDLASHFPPLNTEVHKSADQGDQALAAYRAKRWQKAQELLSSLEQDQELTGDQHQMMGFALWWLGKDEEIISRFETAYNAFRAEGNPQSAAIAALEIAEMLTHNLSPEVAAGWAKRAERLLGEEEDSPAKGYLYRWQAVKAFDSGDLEKALDLSRKVGAIGAETLDGGLEVLSLQDQGRFLVASGQFDEGMALMDEAMVGAVAGDVNPIVVGRSYCNMLAVCDQTGDVRRAAEWSEAADRWCRDSESSPYPGICRIYKAEIMWQNGDWVGAESEVMRASTELGLYTDISGEAFYQYGEMRLRAGDYEGAERAFQEALTRGREPVPGYALVLAHRNDMQSALDVLDRALSEPHLSKLSRARFLPVLIDLSLQNGDVGRAEEALTEFVEIAELARSDLFKSQASQARGRIELAKGHAAAAIGPLRDAVKTFARLGLPFESAQAHADLGRAYIGDGASAMAQMELRSAKGEFERLGSEANAAEMTAILESINS